MRHLPLSLAFFGLAALLPACVGDSPITGGDSGTPDTGTPSDGGDGGADGPTCTSPTQACGPSCVDVSKSAANCGACGHDCLGGTCASGVCQPVTMTTATTPSTNQSRIATDGTSVCWTVESSTGFVYCVPTSATAATPTQVFSGKKPGPVAVKNGTVFWTMPDATTSSTLVLAKGTPSSANSQVSIRSFAIFGGDLWYYGDQLVANANATVLYVARTVDLGSSNNLEILSVQADGSGYTVALTISEADPLNARANGMDIDGAAVYFSYGTGTTGTVTRYAISGGSTTQLSTTEALPGLLSVDSGYAYWETGTKPIRRSIVSSSAPGDVVLPSTNVGGLVAVNGNVYWTEMGSADIYTAPASGGARTTYVAGAAGVDDPGNLTHDAKAIYWGDRSSGAIHKVAFK